MLRADLSYRFRHLTLWFLSALIDSLYLGLWALTQWAVSYIFFDQLALRGFDIYVLIALRVLFALATLAPVAILIYRDTRLMLIRAQSDISDELAGQRRDA